MPSKAQQFLLEAAACERSVAAARNPEDEAVYREMARLWLRLARRVQSDEQREKRPG